MKLSVNFCICYVCEDVNRGQRRVFDCLELESYRQLGGLERVLGSKLGSFERASKCF